MHRNPTIGYAVACGLLALCLGGCGGSDPAPVAGTAATADATTQAADATTQAVPRAAAAPTTTRVPNATKVSNATKVPRAVKPRLTVPPRPTVTTPAVTRPKPRRTTSRPAPAEVYYPNCSAVRAAGAAPIHRGEPGYSRKLDRDGDGVACET